jgi:hypothetical protein
VVAIAEVSTAKKEMPAKHAVILQTDEQMRTSWSKREARFVYRQPRTPTKNHKGERKKALHFGRSTSIKIKIHPQKQSHDEKCATRIVEEK